MDPSDAHPAAHPSDAHRPKLPAKHRAASSPGQLPSHITVRPAKLADAAWMALHDQDIFGLDAWSEQTYRAELTAADRTYLVALNQAGAILGWGGLWSGDPAQIMTLATLPAYRRQGVARRIMRELIGYAHNLGQREVWLEVRADDAGAQALYRALGFRGRGIRKQYYRDGDALVMSLALAPDDPGVDLADAGPA